jgi:hypothetical protein
VGFLFIAHHHDPSTQTQRAEEKPSIAFRSAAGDYFATVATILDLFRQDVNWKRPGAKRNNASLGELRDELLVLQKDYQISRKH